MNAPTDREPDTVLVERDGEVATVILNRPDKLNALTLDMWARVGTAMAELDGDGALRCVVLRGAGDKALGPGADITEFPDVRSNSSQAEVYGATMHGSMAAIRDCRHPVIALIKGLCVGGALELALMCDMRVCGESSRFGVPINRLGLVMAYPEVQALVALVGPAVALEILFEARVFGAEEALAKGLVNRVVPDDDVEDEVYGVAARIAEGAPLVNRWHKQFVSRVVAGIGPANPLSADEIADGFACFDTEDFKEGVRAFLAKEKPAFKGK
jgi:enoyl-CoA hydratase/carnithine racemase